MFSINNYDYECTKKCKCKEHGKAITSALTKRSINSDKLAAFIAKTCRNFAEITDTLGRSALHVASSVDRYTIVEWLLNHGALINAKDSESGSTALHRAIFYGCIDCAVLLMRYGASLDLPDDDFRLPLQHVCRFNDLDICKTISVNNELLVWGTNKNYNLGTGNEQRNSHPHFIDFFRKENICVESVAISGYHSLFLDKKGIVYSVGHGEGGRLGIGSENSLPSPKRVKISSKGSDEKVKHVSCSKNHSLLLTNKGNVFATGINTDQQLGIKPAPEKLTSFKEVSAFSQYGTENLQKVIARDHHSIAYSNKELFVWGANHGQFGLSNNVSHVLLPRQVTFPEKTIRFVDSNNVAIACCTSQKQVFVCYNYKLKSVKSPTMEDIKSICLAGGDEQKSNQSSPNPLKLLVLTDTNNIYIWYEDSQKFLRCTFAYFRVLDIEKILFKSNQVMLLSRGDVYLGKVLKVPIYHIDDSQSAWFTCSFKKDMCIDQKIRFEVKRVPNVDRAVDIACDDDFESFIVVQENSRKYFVLPQLMGEEYNFKKLLNDASEFDSIHDVAFHVDSEIFCVHKFIVYSRSQGLKTIIEQYQDKNIYLNFKDLTGKMFGFVLKHIYANYFLTEEDIDEIHHSLGPYYEGDRWSACELFLKFVEKFELPDLAAHLASFSCYPENLSKSLVKPRYNFSRLRATSFPNLYDVTIKCANDREIQAHKCILVTRLDYFNMMFNNSWSENKIINLSTIPYEYMAPIIDFLYSADVDGFRKQNYSENFLYNMIVICDQFFINRLRKVCEILVLEKISIKKCGEMLDFACTYSCSLLKRGCLDFICQNLARVLIQRSLDACEPEVLQNINSYYRKIFQQIFDFRMITPDSDAVSDELLQAFVHDFVVDLEYKMSEDSMKKVKGKTKTSKSAQSKRNYEREAISSMKELSLNAMKSEFNNSKRRSSVEKEAEELNEKYELEAKSWMKVYDKREGKKKSASVALKPNVIIMSEAKPKGEFVNLTQLVKGANKTPTKVTGDPTPEQSEISPPAATRPIFNLGDFTPLKGAKLSQKQRKRLSSESKADVKVSPTKPISIPDRPNAWGVTSPPSLEQLSLADIIKSPKSPTNTESGSPEKSIWYADKVKSPPENRRQVNNVTPNTSGTSSSFMQIVEDERRQKEYCERMKSKPLILTQIEEAAIAELKQFYNVDNIDDEIITIERKSVPITMSFAVWQRN